MQRDRREARRKAGSPPGTEREEVDPCPFLTPIAPATTSANTAGLRRAGDDCTTPCTTPVPLPFRLQTAADVLALLGEQVEAVRGEQEAGTLEKARTVGYLAGIALRAIEAGNLAARLEALEAVLKLRNGDGKR